MADLYVNAFDRRNGRVIDVPLHQVCNGCESECEQCASLVAVLPSPQSIPSGSACGSTSSAKKATSAILAGDANYMFPPRSFSLTNGSYNFNYLGAYNITVSGTVSGTPGTSSSLCIAPVPSGGTNIIGPPKVTPTTGVSGSASFSYPFLVNVPSCGSDISFVATTNNCNVSILNGTINIIKVCEL